MLKKALRFFLLVILGLLGLAALLYVIVDKPMPIGTHGNDAEKLADEMLAVLNKEGFDSLSFIDFSYRDESRYKWDLENNSVVVLWEDYEVYVDLNNSMEAYDYLQMKAYQNFINGSFWFIAPFKVRDEGVIRSTVEVDGGRGLLVTYSSGGLTPGDSYLWTIDQTGRPISWELWTSNIPIGGLKISWDGWVRMEDVWFSTKHEGKLITIPIEIHSVR